MAEYIDKENLKFLEIPIAPVLQGEQVHYEQGFLKEWLESIPTADVVERSEYEEMVKSFKAMVEIKNENLIAMRDKYYTLEKEYAELKVNIKKSIEEMERIISDTSYVYTGAGVELALKILKRNIGE